MMERILRNPGIKKRRERERENSVIKERERALRNPGIKRGEREREREQCISGNKRERERALRNPGIKRGYPGINIRPFLIATRAIFTIDRFYRNGYSTKTWKESLER